MGIYLDRGWWYFVKRVPKRFAHFDPRQRVSRALRTDSKREAAAKAVFVESEFMAYWEALAAGETPDAMRRYEAARKLAEARGFAYYTSAELLQPGAEAEMSARLLEGLAGPSHVAPWAEVEALLGLADPPQLTLSRALTEFLRLTVDRVAGKSEKQAYKWRLSRERAVANFIEAVGDKPIAEITRGDAMKYRTWWQEKIDRTGQNPGSANKDFGHIADVFRTVSDLLGLGLASPFDRMRLKSASGGDVPPFSTAWIKSRLIAPGALAGLNAEARDAFLMMVNTGARPSEILGMLPIEMAVNAAVPHLVIQPRDGRSLKTRQSEREIPLAGVSLEAARRVRASGGFERYALKSDTWSAATNKFLTKNGLRESPAHHAYSLRHSFEDRLLEAGVDERLRIELMGHVYNRPAYGPGGSLELKARAVALIAL